MIRIPPKLRRMMIDWKRMPEMQLKNTCEDLYPCVIQLNQEYMIRNCKGIEMTIIWLYHLYNILTNPEFIMKFPRFLRQWLKCVCCLWLFSIVKRVQAKTSVRHFLHHWVLSGRKSSGNTVILFYIFVYHAIQISKKVRMTILDSRQNFTIQQKHGASDDESCSI